MQAERRAEVKSAVELWKSEDDLLDFAGRPIAMMDTWKTGQKEGLLSSQVVANDFVSGNRPWVNAMPKAVVENADNVKDIFSTNWTENEIEEGRQRIYSIVEDTISKGTVLLLAKNQEKLFPNIDCWLFSKIPMAFPSPIL